MDSELDGRGELSVSESFNEGRDSYHIATRPKFYTEQFERVCPYYIAFGMTYEQFWDGDIEIATMYRKAHEIKLDEANSLAWLQGSYVYQAVGALAPVLKAFCKGKAQPYLKEPYGKSQKKEIVSEIELLNSQHNYLDFLSGIRVVVDNQNAKSSNVAYHILILNYDKKTLRIMSFGASQIEKANEIYNSIEATRAENKIDAVLVRVSSISTLKKAYPNYFSDIGEFIALVKSYLK